MYRIPNFVSYLLQRWLTLKCESAGEPKLYLTFDDGPDPATTPKLLLLLREHHAQVSFFPVGQNAEKHPELIEAMKRAGHAVHLHSWTHVKLASQGFVTFKEETIKCRELLRSNIYRPPYGKIPLRHFLWIRRMGFRVMLWNVDLCDYSAKSGDNISLQHIMNKIRPGDIILLHNRADYQDDTFRMTRLICEEFSQRNWKFEPIW